MFTITLPVAPHVKKFLLIWYGPDYILTLNDSLGKSIHALLRKKINSVKGTRQIKEPFYTIKVPASKIQREGCVIHTNNLYLISEQFDKYFRDIIFYYAMINASCNEGKYKESLRQALAFFDITEDDISLESLYRDFTRKRAEPPFSNLFKKK